MLENCFDNQIDISLQHLQQLGSMTDRGSILPRSLGQQQDEFSPKDQQLLENGEEISQTLERVQLAIAKLSEQNHELAANYQVVEAERQHYQELFDYAPEAYLLTDLNAVIQEANWAAAELLKYSRRRLVGQSLMVFISGLPGSNFHSHLRLLQSGCAIRNWEICLQTRRSDTSPVSCTVVGVQNSQGKVVGLRWLLRNIAEVSRTQQELDLSTAMEYAVEGISLLNSEGCYVRVNSAYASQLGYHPKDMIGMKWQLPVHSEDRESVKVAYEQMQFSGKAEVEARGVRKDGSISYKHLVMIRVCRHQNFNGCYCFMRDISERKAEEERSRQQNEREQLISGIAQRLLMSLNLNEILNTAVAEVRNFLQVERVAIYQLDEGRDARFVVESVAAGCSSVLDVSLQDPCFEGECIAKYQKGYVCAEDDVCEADIPPCYLKLLERAEIRALLLVPIVFKGQLWGLLCAHQCSQARRWQPYEGELLKSLATHLAIAIQQAELYQQLEVANQELQRLATSDGLTEVANRRRFDEYLDAEWQRLAREKVPLSLIMCDVDFFKLYNDTYGHQAGDECLKKVARAIERAIRRSADVVARYGGEEFAVILPHTEINGAAVVAEAIQSEVKALEIEHSNSQVSQYVTLSLGIASIIPSPESSATLLIAAADEALYQAKEEGRDRMILKNSQPSG